ncbi:LuxR C-terminal-related transcriptional regulator [Herbiconiux sp. L3-i23]|uniref:LuxR C-terminal-related transcriptional regulator n=1 Tax=Herbiconiux sp. L3-i23 TaxID=2905871 RepID=UPI0020681242|nr:LuxR C-terminal-related transcriptional regulator [Herbiconiux sp. L3-i23]BDI22348.1 LuxR family transcriptional regulator [Herbiconiux sp. L3-i23]
MDATSPRAQYHSRPLARAAREFLDQISAVPGARIVVAITGARGSGKSALLDAVRDELSAHRTSASAPQGDAPAAEDEVVLVDDAHLLAESRIRALRDLVDGGTASVIVAYPPFRRSPALHELSVALERHRPPIALGPLDRNEIAAVLGVHGAAPSIGLVEAVEYQTAGMPWLVTRLARQLGTHPAVSDLSRAAAAVVERLTVELGALDPTLRDLLVALAVGFDSAGWIPPGEEDRRRLDAHIADARDAGLLDPHGTVVPIVRRAILQSTPAYRIRALHGALVDAITRTGDLDPDVARELAKSRLHDARVEAVLVAAADAALDRDPAVAAGYYDAAVQAGSDPIALAARRARAALCAGDVALASRYVDEHLAQADADAAAVADVSAALWAHRGLLERAAASYRFIGGSSDALSSALAAVTMLAVGDVDGAERLFAALPTVAPPTLAGASIALMARGVRESLAGQGPAALGSLVRAADAMSGSRTLMPMPESPAALCAITALHLGDLDTAAAVLDTALDTRHCGAAMTARHSLLRAWVWMQNDRPDLASRLAEDVAARGPLLGRDQFTLAALRVAVARRADDLPGLVASWRQARNVLLHVPVDLFGLLPLGELMIAAARLHDRARAQAAAAEGWQLLERLGSPPLWSAAMHWAEVQAAILAERPADLAHHGGALTAMADANPLAAACATAARTWADVLTESIDTRAVIIAAKGLAAVGRTWDGSRLAGHAAAHVDDRKEMARLLACARDMHPGSGLAHPITEPVPAVGVDSGRAADDVQLSAREREVAALFVEGRSYREIGEAMFISPRTVEHHMARIRGRIEASTRSELVARLRRLLGERGPDGSGVGRGLGGSAVDGDGRGPHRAGPHGAAPNGSGMDERSAGGDGVRLLGGPARDGSVPQGGSQGVRR